MKFSTPYFIDDVEDLQISARYFGIFKLSFLDLVMSDSFTLRIHQYLINNFCSDLFIIFVQINIIDKYYYDPISLKEINNDIKLIKGK